MVALHVDGCIVCLINLVLSLPLSGAQPIILVLHEAILLEI
jgi:hypothetical protein